MGRNDPMRNHLGRIRIVAKLQRHPATFPYMIFLHRWPFCIRHHFTFVFVLSLAVIVRFAIESFCSVFSCLFRGWDRWFYKDHRSFFNFYMFYKYNRLFCRNVFFTLSAAHIVDLEFGTSIWMSCEIIQSYRSGWTEPLSFDNIRVVDVYDFFFCCPKAERRWSSG